jgi:multidrug resistance efflux pump
MNAGRAFRTFLRFPLAVLKGLVLGPWALLTALWSGGRRLLLSARAWVLFVLLVIAALVAYYVESDRHTPFTTDAYVQAYVVQVAPRVEGQVVHVYVQENQAVSKGELLFEIDRRPFEYQVALLEAKRVAAVQQVAQLESELSAAKAEDARLVAEEAYARVVHEQEKEIFKQDATTDRKYVEAAQKYKAAQAALERSRAQVRKAEQALAARVGEEHALVAEVTAQLDQARLNLEWTRVYAPANGYVTNVQLREGCYIHVGAPVLTCIDGDQWWVVANLRENGLENVRPGQRVGLTFNNYPGRVFPGVVQSVGWGGGSGAGSAVGQPARRRRAEELDPARPALPGADHPPATARLPPARRRHGERGGLHPGRVLAQRRDRDRAGDRGRPRALPLERFSGWCSALEP